MAEIILSALIGVVVEKLASAALDKVALSKDIQSQLNKLKTSLPKIQALLNDAAEKAMEDKRVKDWLNRLQNLAYDIDDVLDSLATDAIHRELTQEPEGGVVRKVRKLFNATFSSSSSSSSSTTGIEGSKLDDITTKLQELYDERSNFDLTVKDKKLKNINRIYQTSLFDSPNNIVGRGVEKDIILQKLLDDTPCDQTNFSIVPIVGMGGIGKTTLARLLYNEPKVKQHFDLKAWVCVSDEFNSFNISKVIYEATASEEKKEKKFSDLNLLQEALRDQLTGKRFLLVLDDVWSEKIEDWNTLVPPFHAVGPGSKIIITTRKKQLLQLLGNDNPYHLSKLSREDALSLFAQHSLGATNFDSYPTLKSYGEGIVHKCEGLPLALKSLGTSMKTRRNEEDWKELMDSKIWSLKDEGGILPALRLSYHELPACLKQMFAYSSLFPKDYVFEKDDLILLWMAEGFLHKSTAGEPVEMERLGEKYFDELLSRSFFEHVNSDESLFVMHDLMNDLATSVAGEFFVRLDIEMKNKIEEQSLKKCRHMSFVREKFMTCKKFEAFKRANSLRSFLAVPIVRDRWENFHLPNKILVDILPQLPLLRVLCLSNILINEVPESVGDLKHLRYLNLSETRITHLPDNVCNLYNLQTLIVFGCHTLKELPESFSKLKNLRHFDIRDTPLLNMPLGIGEMKNLQTLSKIVIGGKNEFPISGLKNLKNLRRRVCIDGLHKLQNNDLARDANLSQMKLRELVVGWSDVFDGSRNQRIEKEVLDVLKPHRDNLKNLEIMSYGGSEFPKWVADSSFCKLTDVRMYKCRNCVILPPLGQLPSLKKLSITGMYEVKEVGSELLGNSPTTFPSLEILHFEDMLSWEIWSVNAVGVVVFPCLKELHIKGCRNMARWEVRSANADVGVFPCLEKLSIVYCDKLVTVSLEALPSLRVLSLCGCGDVLLTSLVGAASSVTKLSINYIPGLSDEVWGGVVQYLGAVEHLSISNCEELVGIGGGEEEEEGSNLPLPTSLRMLDISFCKNLKHLSCPDSIEFLMISDCENLEHLSCPGDSIQKLIIAFESIKSVSFPTELEKELERSESLRIMPILEDLRIYNWTYLKSTTKFKCFSQLMNLEIVDCGRIEAFPDLHDLVSLKHLNIMGCRSMDGPPLGVSGVWPPKLDSLKIGVLKRPISEWGPLPTSIVNLSLWGAFEPSSAEEDDVVKSFPASLLPYSSSSSLTTLELWYFKNMERISSEGIQHLTSLQHLHIEWCPKLKDLPETLLPSLLSLGVYECEELKEKMMSKRGSYWTLLSHIPNVSYY